jgi:hypothetical protein
MPRDHHEGRRRSRRKPDQKQPTIDDSPRGPGVEMARVLSHPLRFKILIAMNTPVRRLSPSEFSDETGEPLSNSSYHFRVLDKAGCIEVVETIPRRGAEEHVYEPKRRAMAWTREWERLGPYVRQNVAASALAPALVRLGASIDHGDFDKRNDSHLSWDTLWTDEQGWTELHTMFREHLENLLEVTDRIKKRMDADDQLPRFLATYFMATFETPPIKGNTFPAGEKPTPA